MQLLLPEWNTVAMLKAYSTMILHIHNVQLYAPAKGDGTNTGAAWRYLGQAPLKPLQRVEVKGILQRINFIAPVNQRRKKKTFCC